MVISIRSHRFAAGESPGRTHEFSRVAHALHIDQNAPGSWSSPGKSIMSPKSISIMEPGEANMLKPIPALTAQSSIALPRAPL